MNRSGWSGLNAQCIAGTRPSELNMKITKLLPKAAVLIAIAMFAGTSAHALTATQAKALRKAVLGVAVPEMPSKAAELVLQAEPKEREAVAVTVVRAVVFQYKSSAASVVATVSKAAPEVAPAVAAAAAELSRGEAVQIAQAAATAAPEATKQIAASVTTAAPSSSPVLAAVSNPTPNLCNSVRYSSESGSADVRGSASGGGPPSSGTITRNNNGRIHSTGGIPDPFPGTPPFGTPPPVVKPYNAPRN